MKGYGGEGCSACCRTLLSGFIHCYNFRCDCHQCTCSSESIKHDLTNENCSYLTGMINHMPCVCPKESEGEKASHAHCRCMYTHTGCQNNHYKNCKICGDYKESNEEKSKADMEFQRHTCCAQYFDQGSERQCCMGCCSCTGKKCVFAHQESRVHTEKHTEPVCAVTECLTVHNPQFHPIEGWRSKLKSMTDGAKYAPLEAAHDWLEAFITQVISEAVQVDRHRIGNALQIIALESSDQSLPEKFRKILYPS